MSLVKHKDGYRRSWMFPRNIRKIYPWKMSKILLIFLNKSKADWLVDRNAQDDFYKELERSGLKSRGFQRHINDGGARTYYAQLKSLGLIFSRKKEGRKYDFPTLAGEALINGKTPLEVMQYLLFKHQYPSSYSCGSQVKIHPEIQVKPFMFVLKLLNMDGINSLSTQELAVPIIYGHNCECLDLCAEKIRALKAGSNFKDILDDPEKDTYLPSSQRDVEGRIKSIKDIANTCKNYMEACFLINIKKQGSRHLIEFNDDIREKYLSELPETENFIPVRSEEEFQRRYGCWGKRKDTRHLIVEDDLDKMKVEVSRNMILSEFFELCGKKKISKVPGEFLEEMGEKWGFDSTRVQEVVEPYLERALDVFESTFLELSRGGQGDAVKFEKSLTKFFREELFFESYHTGQKKTISDRRGGYADVFLIALDNKHCALVDAKATSNYTLPADDHRSMAYSYISNYNELAEEYNKGNNLKLEFSLYVAHGYSATVDSKLKDLSSEVNHPVSALKAKTLLELSEFVTEKKLQGNFRKGIKEGGKLSKENFSFERG